MFFVGTGLAAGRDVVRILLSCGLVGVRGYLENVMFSSCTLYSCSRGIRRPLFLFLRLIPYFCSLRTDLLQPRVVIPN